VLNALISFRFRSNQRVLKSKDFRKISQVGTRVFVKDFLAVVSNAHTDIGRIGITVSKKCSKKAVERNRIKRLVRESYRLNADCLQTKDVVVIAKVHTSEKPNPVLSSELNRLWKKVAHV
jgi:ribonuclease P protein component